MIYSVLLYWSLLSVTLCDVELAQWLCRSRMSQTDCMRCTWDVQLAMGYTHEWTAFCREWAETLSRRTTEVSVSLRRQRCICALCTPTAQSPSHTLTCFSVSHLCFSSSLSSLINCLFLLWALCSLLCFIFFSSLLPCSLWDLCRFGLLSVRGSRALRKPDMKLSERKREGSNLSESFIWGALDVLY